MSREFIDALKATGAVLCPQCRCYVAPEHDQTHAPQDPLRYPPLDPLWDDGRWRAPGPGARPAVVRLPVKRRGKRSVTRTTKRSGKREPGDPPGALPGLTGEDDR